MQFPEGRTAQPLIGTMNTVIDGLRLCLISVSLVGLFWVLFYTLEDERKSRPSGANPEGDKGKCGNLLSFLRNILESFQVVQHPQTRTFYLQPATYDNELAQLTAISNDGRPA